jgi:hypothetical protein
MNKDALCKLADDISINTASAFTEFLYNEMLSDNGERQILYSESDVDTVADYYSSELSSFYKDLIQCKYTTEEELYNATDNLIGRVGDQLSKKIADIAQISYSSDQFSELQEFMYTSIADDINYDLCSLFNDNTI